MTLAEQEAFEAAEVIIRFLREHVEEGANVMHFAALSPDSDEQTIRELILEAQDLIDKSRGG